MPTTPQTHYAVTFRDAKSGDTTTLKARSVGDSSLGLGFICVSDFLFDTSSGVVNPAEEALAKRFERVQRLHLQIYAVLTIEEIGPDHAGLSFDHDRSRVVMLHPGPSPGDGG